MREVYAKPFQAAITEAGLRGVMPCYCSINGLPMHASRQYLTGLLRQKMGFEGVTVSDYGGAENTFLYQKTGESKGEAGYRCLKAGLDVELPMPAAFAEMKALFEQGEADEALELVKQADVVILTLGGKNGTGSIATMGEGIDGTSINLPARQDAFIRKAAKMGKPMIGVHFDGRPISSDAAGIRTS